MCARHGDVASPFSLATRNLRRNSRKTPHTRALALLAAQIFSFYFPPCTLHRAPAGQGPSGPGWLATALGFWSGRALATGTARAGLCLIHHHHRASKRVPISQAAHQGTMGGEPGRTIVPGARGGRWCETTPGTPASGQPRADPAQRLRSGSACAAAGG